MPDFDRLLAPGVALIGQQNRLVKLDTMLGMDILLPQRVIGNEFLGGGYTYTLDCLSIRDDIEL